MDAPTELAALRLEIAQLRAAQSSSGNNSSLVRPPKPGTFDGTRRSQVEPWLSQVSTYLKLSHLTGPIAIDHASAYLRDHAATWWRTLCLDAARPNSTTQQPTTWEDFQQRFRQRFQPVTSKESARKQIYSLMQRTSVTDYVNRFSEVTCLIDDMSPAEKLSLFIHGLKDSIKRELEKFPPDDYEAAVLAAERQDAATWRGHSTTPGSSSSGYRSSTSSSYRPFTYSYPPARATPSCSNGPTPMELGALTNPPRPNPPSQARTPHPPLTPTEKQRRRDRGLCMYCGEPGHTLEYCHHKGRPPTSRSNPNGMRPQGSRR